jgi:hypothetical protein
MSDLRSITRHNEAPTHPDGVPDGGTVLVGVGNRVFRVPASALAGAPQSPAAYVDPESETFAQDLVSALQAAGLMEAAPE